MVQQLSEYVRALKQSLGLPTVAAHSTPESILDEVRTPMPAQFQPGIFDTSRKQRPKGSLELWIEDLSSDEELEPPSFVANLQASVARQAPNNGKHVRPENLFKIAPRPHKDMKDDELDLGLDEDEDADVDMAIDSEEAPEVEHGVRPASGSIAGSTAMQGAGASQRENQAVPDLTIIDETLEAGAAPTKHFVDSPKSRDPYEPSAGPSGAPVKAARFNAELATEPEPEATVPAPAPAPTGKRPIGPENSDTLAKKPKLALAEARSDDEASDDSLFVREAATEPEHAQGTPGPSSQEHSEQLYPAAGGMVNKTQLQSFFEALGRASKHTLMGLQNKK